MKNAPTREVNLLRATHLLLILPLSIANHQQRVLFSEQVEGHFALTFEPLQPI